jgi:hypothetical protein
MSMTEVWMPSPNYSTGRGPYNKVVLHTTEGAQTIESLGNFFSQSSAGVSSHFGADNRSRGVVGAYVYESNKAWTQGNANPYCLSNELCTPSGAASGWSRDFWLNEQDTLLRNAADWVAWMCAKYSIPIVSLSASQAQDPNVRGVCDHVDLGSWGGNHNDCGPGFPMDQVIAWAKSGTGSTPTPEPPQELGVNMTADSARDSSGRLHLTCIGAHDGKVYYMREDGGNFYIVDPTQSPVRSGAGINIAMDASGTEVVTLTFVAGSGQVGTYSRPVAEGSKFGWVGWGGDAK